MPIEKLNPLHYMGRGDYTTFWQKLFATMLYGFWGRLLFVLLIIAAFWVGVRQRNPTLAAVCLLMAAIVAYGGGILNLLRSLAS